MNPVLRDILARLRKRVVEQRTQLRRLNARYTETLESHHRLWQEKRKLEDRLRLALNIRGRP